MVVHISTIGMEEEKKDFDVMLTKGNEEIKIQIKSSADEKFRFRTIKVDVDNPNKVTRNKK
jgi:hypothetical protein